MFVEYLYQSSYNVPARLGIAERCILLARLFRLAEYTLMVSSKGSALRRLTDLLKESTTPSLRQALRPYEVLDLLEIAYGGMFGGTKVGTCNTDVEQHSAAPEVDNGAGCIRCDLEAEDSAAFEVPGEQTDPQRRVTAKYSAVLIEELQKDTEFRRMFFQGRETASDIMSFVRPAYSLGRENRTCIRILSGVKSLDVNQAAFLTSECTS